MGFVREFRQFVIRGNVLDLAVAVILGAAFGRIVDSLVKDILMPPAGLLLGGVDFANHFVTLKGARYATLAEAQAAGAVTINYGAFVNAVVTFLIVGFAAFLVVKRINAAPPPAPSTRACPECLSDIPLAARRCRYCGVS